MIYGRIIIIGTHYYNKLMDIDGISYFVNLNGKPTFISMKSEILDRKIFNYNLDVILKSGNTIEKAGIPLDELLCYSPFVKGLNNKRTNYYKKNKKKCQKFEKKPVTINFD